MRPLSTASTLLLGLLSLLALPACQKDEDPAAAADEWLYPGKGVRAIGRVANYNRDDLSGYATASVGWDGADQVYWLYHFYSSDVRINATYYKGYQKAYRLGTGDTIATGGFTAPLDARTAGTAHEYYHYAPHTVNLWYATSLSQGARLTSVQAPRNYQYPPYGRQQVYPDHDYITTNWNGRFQGTGPGGGVKNMLTFYSSNGVEKSALLPLQGYFTNGVSNADERSNSRCQAAGLDLNDTPLLFSMGGDSLKVYNILTRRRLAAAPARLLERYAGAGNLGSMFLQRSRDGRRFVGYVFDTRLQASGPTQYYLATFTYEPATNRLAVLVDNHALTDVQGFASGYPMIACDEQGVAYYVSTSSAIKTVGPAGVATRAENFLARDCFVSYLNVIGNKVFLVANKPVRQNILANTELNRAALCVLE